MTNTDTTQTMPDVLKQRIRNLIMVEPFWPEPEGGYAEWSRETYQEDGFSAPRGTIPDRIIEAEAMARYWGQRMPEVMTGTYIDKLIKEQEALSEWDEMRLSEVHGSAGFLEIAQESRYSRLMREVAWCSYYQTRFYQDGEPLYIGIYADESRYLSTVPVLRRVRIPDTNRYVYIVGQGSNHKVLGTEGEIDIAGAIMLSKHWFLTSRAQEIQAAQEKAKAVVNIPRATQDILVQIVKTKKSCLDTEGNVVISENGGVHGFYRVSTPAFAYVSRMGLVAAVKLLYMGYALSAKQGQETSPLDMTLYAGRLPAMYGFDADPDKGVVKSDAVLAVYKEGQWLVKAGSTPFVIQIVRSESVVSIALKCVQKGAAKDEESAVPTRWGLTDVDLVAWGMHRIAKKV